MAAPTAGNVFSFEHMQVWRLNSVGAAVGTGNPDALSTNTVYSALKVKGPVTAKLPDPSYVLAVFKGGGTIEGQAYMGIDSQGEGEITLSTLDDALINLTTGASQDTTSLSNSTINALNSQLAAPVQLGMMLSARIQSRDSSTGGSNYWISFIFPKIQGRIKIASVSGEGGDNPNPVTFSFAPTSATTFPNGIAFSATQGWQSNSEIMYWQKASYPYGLTTFVQDGAATTFTLPYKPVLSTVTGGNTDNWVTQNYTATAPTSINTSNGLVTKAAAGTSGQLYIVQYPTNFISST